MLGYESRLFDKEKPQLASRRGLSKGAKR